MEFEINEEFVTNLIRSFARKVKLERLKEPFSMLSPEPRHFPQFSKLSGKPWVAEPVMAAGLEMDALHDNYGMPRDLPQMILTMAGVEYGQEFADFTVEFFGLKGETDSPDIVEPLARRTIGDKIHVSNVDADSVPHGAGGSLMMIDNGTGECLLKLYVWRWRVFMDNSSLCLENNWHTNKLTGGGWIPFILGIMYNNPDKTVEDMKRFAPAFKLCNLVDAALNQKRGGRRNVKVADLTDDVKKALGKRYAELGKSLTDVKQAAKTLASAVADWKPLLLSKHPILNSHPDLLDKLDPHSIPDDADAPDKIMAPWEVAIEIAARETILNYEPNSVSSTALKQAAIIPNKE